LDFILQHHNNWLALQISNNVHKAWAIFKGFKASDAKFEDFMKVELCIPKVYNHSCGWECGHQVVANFVTYQLI
jgi:hypothetical protein